MVQDFYKKDTGSEQFSVLYSYWHFNLTFIEIAEPSEAMTVFRLQLGNIGTTM